ncbi:NAD(P)H-binding protein [Proteiniphilum sp. X52]|uniref:NAD(P)H-binding protein n=1 Tax=Proteiniphilum sp. X52 TaxID=2382159 RepID=UPI0021012C33|nr:NAD(P)H-binding protein [Proteiniphilum sp. X52]
MENKHKNKPGTRKLGSLEVSEIGFGCMNVAWAYNMPPSDLLNRHTNQKMTRIIIIGATGGLAQNVIETAKKADNIQLTLFARTPGNLSARISGGTTVVQGDAMNIDDLKRAIAGQDLVYVNLSGDLDKMSQNIITAMKETGVRRIVAISSIGIYEEPLQAILKPYRKLADNIEASGLDYTVIRPNWFTSDNEIDYHITRKPEPEVGGAVSRKSIADLVTKIFANPGLHKNENIGISKLR